MASEKTNESKGEMKMAEKCPVFDGNKERYEEWKGKMEDWLWKWKRYVEYPGITVRGALSGEPWKLVAGLSREEIGGTDGEGKIFEILDKKYAHDKRKEKLNCMDALFRVERKDTECMQDYVSRFDLLLRAGKENGMKDMGMENEGGLLLTRAKLGEQDKRVVIGMLDGDWSYAKVSEKLLSMFGQEKEKEKREILLEESSTKKSETKEYMRCYSCGQGGHISKWCREKKENTEIPKREKWCWRCDRKGHNNHECWFKEKTCFQCKEKGHAANACKKEKEERGNATILFGTKEIQENDWETVKAIIDTGCEPTIMGEL